MESYLINDLCTIIKEYAKSLSFEQCVQYLIDKQIVIYCEKDNFAKIYHDNYHFDELFWHPSLYNRIEYFVVTDPYHWFVKFSGVYQPTIRTIPVSHLSIKCIPTILRKLTKESMSNV